MFQKNLPEGFTGIFEIVISRALSGTCPAHVILNELKQQRQDGIDQGCREDPLRGVIPVRIDIDRKKGDVQHQAGNRYGSDLRFVGLDEPEKFADRIQRIELHEIVDGKAKDRRDQSQNQPQSKVVFFEYHDFHVFSSLLLRT